MKEFACLEEWPTGRWLAGTFLLPAPEWKGSRSVSLRRFASLLWTEVGSYNNHYLWWISLACLSSSHWCLKRANHSSHRPSCLHDHHTLTMPCFAYWILYYFDPFSHSFWSSSAFAIHILLLNWPKYSGQNLISVSVAPSSVPKHL